MNTFYIRILPAIRDIITAIGDDNTREGLKETPNRVARMYAEIFRGYDRENKPKLTTFPNGRDGINYNQIIVDKGYFFSTCEHHFCPFFGSYSFGYIASNKVVGLSKISRLIDFFSCKLQVQERLTKEIVEEFQNTVKPKGCILVMKARHLCKEMRGVKKINSEMITSQVTGVFDKDLGTRQEFFQLIK